MMLNERHGDRDPRLCIGYNVNVKFMSHVCPVSHRRMWDVRRALSKQAVNHSEILNFRSPSSSALLCTPSHRLMSFMFCIAQKCT